MRVIGLVVLIGAVLLIGIVVVMGGFSWPESYELPDGLKGWVVIRYEIPSCPPMRNAGIFRIVVVDASGSGCTSESAGRGGPTTATSTCDLMAVECRFAQPAGERTASTTA